MNLLKNLSQTGLLSVCDFDDGKTLISICKVLYEMGILMIQIDMEKEDLQIVEHIHKEVQGAFVGVGKIVTQKDVDMAVNVGADFISTDACNEETVKYCKKRGIFVIPCCSSFEDVKKMSMLDIKCIKILSILTEEQLIEISELCGDISIILAYNDAIEQRYCYNIGRNNIIAYSTNFNNDDKDNKEIKRMVKKGIDTILGMDIGHIGINSPNKDEAEQTVNILSKITGWDIKETVKSYFAGKGFEVMHNMGRGKNGHIALLVNDIECAVWYLKKRGVVFDEESRTYTEDGRCNFIYMRDEIAGFAFHLLLRENI